MRCFRTDAMTCGLRRRALCDQRFRGALGVAVSLFLAFVAVMGGANSPVLAEKVGVRIENRSEPVLCAEKDNVTLTLAHPEVTRFRIEVVHPVYIDMMRKDSFEADWTACDFAGDATSQPPPKKFTLYEDVELWVIGYTFPNFWRERSVPVRIGERTAENIHLLQVWVRHDERAEEVLVLYPTDGYWRARPLPPKQLGWSAYGSSFLIGPVEDAGRPVVNLEDVRFDPKTLTFELTFAGGGQATLRIAELTRDAQVLDVSFSAAIKGPPFAALRSMYITQFNNDVAAVAVQEKDAPGWAEAPVMVFPGAETALKVWAGRHSASRHNTSSPDMTFRDFETPPKGDAPPAEPGAKPKAETDGKASPAPDHHAR